LLAQSVLLWIDFASRFCENFLSDFGRLRNRFSWNTEHPVGSITSVRPGLSDRHFGGRTVTECVLHTGERVIYKPRSVAGEAAFCGFVAGLKARGSLCGLNVTHGPDQDPKGGWGVVPAIACRTDWEVERFSARAGVLLAVLHVLAVTDVHCENLIASGEYPVVI